jgi:hypothetical protein
MNIQKMLISALLVLSPLMSMAQSCKMVIPYQAGGPGEDYTRAMQEANPNIDMIQFKPGAFAARSIDFMADHPEYLMAGSPLMWSTKNPNKNKQVELVGIVMLFGNSGVTGRNVSMTDLLSKDLIVAVPNIGGSQHLLALQLQQANPKLTIVPTPGGPQLLQAVVNKEVDLVITAAKSAHQMSTDFGANLVFDVPATKREVSVGKVSFTNYAMFALFIHTSATAEQKKAAKACYDGIMSSPKMAEAFSKRGVAPFLATKAEETKYINQYLAAVEKYGL